MGRTGEGGGGGGGGEEERIIDWTTQKLIVSLSSRIGMEDCPKRSHCLAASCPKICPWLTLLIFWPYSENAFLSLVKLFSGVSLFTFFLADQLCKDHFKSSSVKITFRKAV
jgi:hypothetical protein